MDAPEDFVAFVRRHEAEVRETAEAATGSDLVVDRLRRELFASVAARWSRLTRQGFWRRWPWKDEPAAYLQRRLNHSALNWTHELPDDPGLHWEFLDSDRPWFGRPVDQYQRKRPEPTSLEAIANDAWNDGVVRHGRRQLAIRGGLVVAFLLGLILPRSDPPPYVSIDPERNRPELPAVMPTGVQLLPLSGSLDRLELERAGLPESVSTAAQYAAPLATSPIPAAVMIARDGAGPLILITGNATTRQVPAADLGKATMLTTSLSPDGRRVALIDGLNLLIIDVPTGKLRRVRAPGDAQPAQPRLIWRDPRTVMVPGMVGAALINVDTGRTVFESGVQVLHVAVAQGAARADHLIEMLPAPDGSRSAQIRIRHAPPGPGSPPPPDLYAVNAPTWVIHWTGQGFSNGELLMRPADPDHLLMPAEVGTAGDPVGVVDRRGLGVGTLTAIELGITIEPLGWLAADRALLRVTKGAQTWVVGWSPRSDELTLACRIDGRARLSLADLYRSIP